MGCTTSSEAKPPKKNIYETQAARDFRASRTGGHFNDFDNISGHLPEHSQSSRHHQQQQQTLSHVSEQSQRSHRSHNRRGGSDGGPGEQLTSSAREDVSTRTQKRLNVFVPQISMEDLSNFEVPKFEKSEEEDTFLREKLLKHFLFEHLTDKELLNIIGAFEKVSFHTGENIIRQGDTKDLYFFIVYSGTCTFHVDGVDVGGCGIGDTFGELSLLYASPRAATVVANKTETVCFRVDQMTFRFVLQLQNQQAESEKLKVLKSVFFLKGLEIFQLQKLSTAMTVNSFRTGDFICRKGEIGNEFYILHEGEVKVADISVGNTVYEDFTMGAGEYFGERAIVKSEPRAANIYAMTDCIIYSIDRTTFEKVLGDVANLILRAQDKNRLAGITCIKKTHLSSATMDLIARLITDKNFRAGTKIMKEGQKIEPALYIVRSGKCKVTIDGKDDIITDGGHFGEAYLTMDVGKTRMSMADDIPLADIKDIDVEEFVDYSEERQCEAKHTVEVLEETLCGVLSLKDCRSVFDTTQIGEGPKKYRRSQLEMIMKLEDLRKHAILGQGTFGQVWLATAPDEMGIETPYALKIQSKYELIKNQQAKGAVREMEVMSQLNHPFILRLVKTFQDRELIYLLLGYVQGGELYSRVHSSSIDGLPEHEARFYAAGIVEAISYMHRRQIIYRDLKPENVLIDRHGYPVVIDYGFAKIVPEKTYTLCGSPFYMAPEVILNRGHSVGADHWSLGCVIYEMITGASPFEENPTEIALYMAILKCNYKLSSIIADKKEALDLVQRFLSIEPSERLGVLAGGQMEIYKHDWFFEIDFDFLRNKAIPPPWIPSLQHTLDTSNFKDMSSEQDRTTEHYPDITPDEQSTFSLFGQI